LTAYDEKIEPNVPQFEERIKTFQELSKLTCPDQAIWRYDPILLNKEIDIAWHFKQFENLAKQLSGFTKSCMIAFLIEGKRKDIRTLSYGEQDEILRCFAEITRKYGMQLYTCAQNHDWSKYGIKKAQCTDPELFAQLTGGKIKTKQLDGQRKNCGCIPCVDIGVYNTCTHNCIYCYANGFYGYRGEPKSMLDKLDGEIYDRKTERIFEY
jgi:DNA repair photolyase